MIQFKNEIWSIEEQVKQKTTISQLYVELYELNDKSKALKKDITSFMYFRRHNMRRIHNEKCQRHETLKNKCKKEIRKQNNRSIAGEK